MRPNAPAAAALLLASVIVPQIHAAATHAAGATRAPTYILSPPPVELLANARLNDDGTMTIDGGLHSAAANTFHRLICHSFGASDVTDLGPITLEAQTVDAVVCAAPAGRRPPGRAVPLLEDNAGRLFVPSSALVPAGAGARGAGGATASPGPAAGGANAFTLDLHGPYGLVPAERAYYAVAAADFVGLDDGGAVRVSAQIAEQAGRCGWSKPFELAGGDVTLSSLSFCHAHGDAYAAFAQLLACTGAVCRNGSGEVQHVP